MDPSRVVRSDGIWPKTDGFRRTRLTGRARASRRREFLAIGVWVASLLAAAGAEAGGILRNGVGARALGLGGADVAWAEGPLAAIEANPAALSLLGQRTVDLGLTGVLAEGNFTNRVDSDGSLHSTGIFPEGGFGVPLGAGPVTLGFAVSPESMLAARWQYTDVPGVAGASYGRRTHDSEILLLRSAVGLAVSLAPAVSVGASVGALYNENSLHAPYTFQTQPALKGLKTLLDLDTSGFGWNWNVGLLVRPREDLRFGLAYKSGATIGTTGRANGKIGAQLAALNVPLTSEFHYDAAVETRFPQTVTAGASWNPLPAWRLVFQLDWINWSDAFTRLPVSLSHGSNQDINGLVGSSSFKDVAPLAWRDQLVYRVGVEYAVLEHLRLRAGYAYGRNPVPNRTLTPLTGAIMEHTVSTGIGYRTGRYQVDLGYQYDVPVSRRVRTSDLLSGEYSATRLEVDVHWLSITTSIRF